MAEPIRLGGDFEFRFGKSSFFKSESTQIKDMLGWEYCAAKLSHTPIADFFPYLKIHYLCLTETSLQISVLLENIFKYFSIQNSSYPVFDRVLIDLPQMVEPFLPSILKTYPQSVALAQCSDTENGTFSGNSMSTECQLLHRPICYFESLDSRRLALVRLFEKKYVDKSTPIACVGGTDALLQWQLIPWVQSLLKSCPSELLFSSGLIPFLSARIQLAKKFLDGPAALSSFFTNAAANLFTELANTSAGSTVLIIADAPILVALARQVHADSKSNDSLSGVTDLSRARHRMGQNKRPIAQLWNLNPSNNLEFSHIPGFLSHEFITKVKNYSEIDSNSIEKHPQNAQPNFLNWLDLSREGLVHTFRLAAGKYFDWTRLKMSPAQERDFFRFAHRLAATENMLFPNAFSLLIAAQATVDSNFAFEFLQLCRDFPLNPAAEVALPILDIPLHELVQNTATLNIRHFETLRYKRPQKNLRVLKSPENGELNGLPVSENKYANNDWVNSDHPYSCSFPEEDVFMEEFAFSYRRQARDRIRARETHFSELQTSMKDGLDLRETLRNWHAQKIMVYEEMNARKADVGAIVFNFAEKNDESKFSWKSFWLAENHDNSNLMFYATPYQEELIGPGIAKSEFGGFAVIPLPSLNSFCDNPWTNPEIIFHAKSPAEALLVGGALATKHKTVLYIDNHPPSRRISELLKRSGKTIVHMHVDELPPDKIRRIKTFHILAESGVRRYAEKYIRRFS